MGRDVHLGEFEELVLLAVSALGSDAYGVTIRKMVESEARRAASIGAVYTTLERLEEKGFVSSRQGEATPERGGRAKRYYQIEGAGVAALNAAEAARARLRGAVQKLRPAGGLI